jgi:hypothetical protein
VFPSFNRQENRVPTRIGVVVWMRSSHKIKMTLARAKPERKIMKRSKIQSQFKNVLIGPALALAILGQATSSKAYSNPPTWMPMEMLNVSFNTGNDTLSVVPEGTTPVLNIAANGTYDPTQPWSVLNGTAYSRQLGWNPASSTILNDVQTAYGSGASLWIGLVSETAGLQSYKAVGKYGVNANNTTTVDPTLGAYSGIFGTAGSSLNWQWDGKMDHNAYAVNLSDLTTPNELFSATYKVYVGDSSGNELADAIGASTTTTWTWQGPVTVPEPTTMGLAAAGVLGLLVFRKIKS